MIAKVTIINPTISGVVSSQEQKEFNYELLLTTIYKGQDGKSAYEIALEHGFVGTEEEWIASNKLVYKIVTELPEVGDSSIFYLIKKGDSYEQYAYNNGEYVLVGNTNINLDDYYTKAETFSKSETNAKLSEKVDKINGKQLSTNDFTTEEKNKLANIKEFAEKNVQPNWEETDQTSDSYIRNKPILFSGDYNDLLNKPDLNKEISEEQLPIASESKKGIVQLATKEEVKNGVDTTKAITPSALKPIIDTLSAKEITGTDSATYSFDVSSLNTIEEIKSKYTGLESLTKVIVATDGILVQVNNENYFRIKIDGNKIRIGGIANVAISDDSLQTNDKSLIGAINEIFTKILVGGAELTTIVYRLRNTTDDSHNVYSLEDPTFKNEGFMLYSDKDCTIPYGRIFSNMSGAIKIDADLSIVWALNGSEEYISDKRIATESAVYNAIKNNTSASAIEWNASSNLNDYTQTGLYHFQGFRTTPTDNLPIDTYGDNINIAFTLIVDRQEGSISETTHIPCIVSQTLFLGNRQGSETKIYVRNATTFLSDGTTTWESWKELVTSTYLGIASSMEDELLNDATEIGLYTGAIVNTSTNTFDVFKLEVINNYAISNQASQLTGSTIPNTVLQTMTVVSLDSTDKQYKRKGNSINDVYQWGEWEEASATSMTKFKMGDVVYRTNVPNFHFGVMSWEEFEANPTNSMDTKMPIGLVVDPVKRTFVFCELLWNGFAQKDEVSFWGGYTSFDDGSETFKRLEGLVNKAYKCAAYQALRLSGYGNESVFYVKQYSAYVPALNEWNKVYNPIFYENIKIDGHTISLMDKFICLKNGEVFYENKYFTKSYLPTKFYSHLSTLCFIDDFEGNNEYNTFVFGVNGTPINYGGAGLCPVFGIYTEEEENA